jgi:hypothetical protein
VRRDVREQQAEARPRIANPLGSIRLLQHRDRGRSDLGHQAPMIMTRFEDGSAFAGKTVHPLATYAMSGLGTTERDCAATYPGATLGEGIAVRGEDVDGAKPAVADWLRRIGLLAADDADPPYQIREEVLV